MPPGLSGAPLIRWGTNDVVGVCVGESSTDVGPTAPWHFGEALWTKTLWAARAPALQGTNLATRAPLAASGEWRPWDPPARTPGRLPLASPGHTRVSVVRRT